MDNLREGVVLYGSGSHGKVVADILCAMGVEVSAIADDNPVSSAYRGIPVVTASDCYKNLIVTIGNCAIRKKIVDKVSVENYVTAIHPSALIAPGVEIGEGTVVAHGAVVQPDASVGRHCIVNTRSVVEHDVKIGDFVHVASGAVVCGGVEIGDGTWIGAGSVVRQCIKIGKNCMIGAGSVVVKDIPDGVTAYGNPCRVVKRNDK